MDDFKTFTKTYKALVSFVNDFVLLSEQKEISQKEISEKSGITQRKISKMETGKTNPTYKELNKLSEAAGGELYITPMGDMTITVPFGMQQKVQELADKKETDVKSLLLSMIQKEIEKKEIEVYYKITQVEFTHFDKLREENICPIKEDEENKTKEDERFPLSA